MNVEEFFNRLIDFGRLENDRKIFSLEKRYNDYHLFIEYKNSKESQEVCITDYDLVRSLPNSKRRYRLIKDVREMCIRLLGNGYELDAISCFHKRGCNEHKLVHLQQFSGKDVEKCDDDAYKIVEQMGFHARIFYYFDPCIVEEYENMGE